jgi:hypothetical protein
MRSLLMIAILAAQTPDGLFYDLEPDQVFLSYQAQLGAAQISGISRTLAWSAGALPDGGALVQIRVPVDSFASGHPEIDSLMRRAMESDRYPEVIVEGVVREGSFSGMATLHGVAQSLEVPLSAVRQGSRLLVRTSFVIALDAFHVVPPPGASNGVEVDFLARLQLNPQAVLGGGAVTPSR